MFAGNAAELVTVAEPLVATTVIEREVPILDGLNGRLDKLYAETVTVEHSAFVVKTIITTVRKRAFFMVMLGVSCGKMCESLRRWSVEATLIINVNYEGVEHQCLSHSITNQYFQRYC